MISRRYVVESEGNWACRIRDTDQGIHYVARMLPPHMAHAAAWVWNHQEAGRILVSVASRFHILAPASGYAIEAEPLFYGGDYPPGIPRP